ncbi:PfkB family carbohydrate kinase [Microbacterium oryzae]|uniref:Sugar kinase n=1 Tax=Microbacterium oryzae TaxID=743009 RepID=A0A6I6E2D6_9MICO|nr:PfkB family carbohydrate kinase [Microbacterium oryzae]QGU28334.1 sugar kinase [Microbacterium oryzae]
MATTPTHDVLLAGPTFFDLVLGGLDASPAPGTEVFASHLDTSPGGIANLAVATARLGLRTALATALGDDVHGRWCRSVLADVEGIDLAPGTVAPGWATPLTVSIAHDGDRAMVTREDLAPPFDPLASGARARAILADLPALRRADAAARTDAGGDAWWRRAVRDGARVFADAGWDPAGTWDAALLDPLDACFAFTPNEREAAAYTREDSPERAARVLAERVPLVVVTRGAAGAFAIDAATGETADVPGVVVDARDTTGAGDVLQAALAFGVLRELSLADAVAFAVLCSALSVEQLGGATASPCWGDIADWRAAHADPRYGFVDDLLADIPRPLPHRADRRFPFARFGAEAHTLRGT